MEQLRISPATMLEDEITWLDNFEPNRTAECETSEADNILLAGHLRLIKTLLSLCGAEKEMLGNYCFISLQNTSALSYCLSIMWDQKSKIGVLCSI